MRRYEIGYYHLISSASRIIVLLKTPQKYSYYKIVLQIFVEHKW